jgi:alpha-L-fucosidase
VKKLSGANALVFFLLHAAIGALRAAELRPPNETDASRALARPTKAQIELQEMAFGLFVHWSPSVYQGSENDTGKTPAEGINPDRFDAGQIVRAAQSCGAGYVVFVAKHVGGYCAWQTKTTDYSLKTSPWKGGKGDMVGELAAACAKAGMKFGVYLCPRDDHAKIANGGRAGPRQAEANAYYREQLTELLTGYGPLFEVWFDGGLAAPVNDLFDKYAPDALTFLGRRKSSTRWVGSEYGTTAYPCWSTVNGKESDLPAKGAGVPDGNRWAPAECDVSILFPKWFWTPGSDARVVGLQRLLDIYYQSVGRGSILLLNITPDDHGAVPEAQMKRLAELGQEIRTRFGKPLTATSSVMQEATGELVLPLGGEVSVDHVRLREDIRGGERVRQFKLEAKTAPDTWTTLNVGSHIGSRQILPFPAIKATELRLQILQSAGPPAIAEFAAFHVGRPVPKAALRPAGTK